MAENEVNDDPIFRSIQDGNGRITPDENTDVETPKFLGTAAQRKWIYLVAVAIIAIVVGLLGGKSIVEQDWNSLILAILGLVPASAPVLALRNLSDDED